MYRLQLVQSPDRTIGVTLPMSRKADAITIGQVLSAIRR